MRDDALRLVSNLHLRTAEHLAGGYCRFNECLQNGWILQSGKNGMGYLLNSANLGRMGGQMFEARICDSGQEAVAFGAYLAPNTVFIPCSAALKAVRVNTSGTPSFTVTTVRGGYGGNAGASPPIIAGGVLWNLDPGAGLLLGFNPSTNQQLFSQALAGTPANFVAPSSGAGHLFAPSGSILEAFNISSGGATPTPTSTSTPTSTPTPQQATYSGQATVSPNPVSRGSTLSIASTVTDSTSENVLIVVRVFDSASNLVSHAYWDNQSLVAGQPRTFPSSWNVPASAATGTYTISIGIYAPNFGAVKSYNGNAAMFGVN